MLDLENFIEVESCFFLNSEMVKKPLQEIGHVAISAISDYRFKIFLQNKATPGTHYLNAKGCHFIVG